MDNLQLLIQELRKQFSCGFSISCFKWKDILEFVKSNPDEVQKLIVDSTVNSELILKYPVQTSYQRMFLKDFIKRLEDEGIDIDDTVYSSYGRLVALPEQSQYYKHYVIIDEREKIISLKESVNLVSDGTTGLRTWQAALVLSEWALQTKKFFRNQTVLELGSGMGLTGLVTFKECSPKCMYLTDCHDTVLEKLKENVILNLNYSGDEIKTTDSRCIYSYQGQNSLSILNLAWENINEVLCKNFGKVDKVIAADIIYDSELFEALIDALKNLSKFSSVDEYIFCCTLRNPTTLDEFMKKLGEAGFCITEIDLPLQRHFIIPSDTFVKILCFK